MDGKQVARSAIVGLVAAGTLAGGILYSGLGHRPTGPTPPTEAAPRPPTPRPEPPSDQVIGLGNLNVIGKGGPDPRCEPIPESPTLSVSVSRSVPRPAVPEICGALRALGPKIEACHLSALRNQAAMPYTLSLYLSVGKHGKVERVTVSEHAPWHHGSPLGTCLAQAMRKLKFASLKASDGEVDLWLHFAAPESL